MDAFEIADELENAEAVVDPGILMPKTEESYDVFLKKLAAFVNFEGGEGSIIPKDLLKNDGVLAEFLLDLGAKHEYKPHFKKTALASISYLFRIHCLPSVFDFKHLYPNLHNALAVSVMLFVLLFV